MPKSKLAPMLFIVVVALIFFFAYQGGKKTYVGGAWSSTKDYVCPAGYCFCYEYTTAASQCYNNALQNQIGYQYVVQESCTMQSSFLDCMIKYGIYRGGTTNATCQNQAICGNIGCTSTCLGDGAVACVSSTQSKKCYDSNGDGCLEWVYTTCTTNQYCPTASGICISNTTTCTSNSDTNCDNCISYIELTAFANRWIATTSTYAELISVANNWISRDKTRC